MAGMTGSHSTSIRGIFVATVLANRRLCDEHYLLRLGVEGLGPTRPGQFVQLQCRGLGEQVDENVVDWPEGRLPRLSQPELAAREPLLRRPFSLAGRRERGGQVELDIIYRTIGIGTHWLTGAGLGRQLSVIGPLGNGFTIRPDKPAAALVGGGVGIPPMIYLAAELARQGKRVVAFNGVRTASHLPLRILPDAEVSTTGRPTLCAEQFAACGVPSAVATDDGSAGFAGLVNEPFRLWLDEAAVDPQELVVYGCGPEAMMKAVAEPCIRRHIECQLALERHMACGMGACQSCVIKIRDDSEQGWSFKLCCTDGPVFDAWDILWQ